MYKTKLIKRYGLFEDGYPELIEKELNQLEQEGYEVISANFVLDNDLFVIYKEKNKI